MGFPNYYILGTAFVLILEQSGKGHGAFGKGHWESSGTWVLS